MAGTSRKARCREMRGATVGIIGYGHIGREVAKRCKAFDMRIMALSRTKRDEPEVVDWYGTLEDMDTLLSESDFVIVTAPLNNETRGMIDSAAFGKMKPDAVICNVGRGAVINEAALYEALSGKHIRGGIIDVWYTYPSEKDPNPWPSRFPFRSSTTLSCHPIIQHGVTRWQIGAGRLLPPISTGSPAAKSWRISASRVPAKADSNTAPSHAKDLGRAKA